MTRSFHIPSGDYDRSSMQMRRPGSLRVLRIVCIGLLVASSGRPFLAAAQAEQRSLAEWTDAEKETFLRDAKILGQARIGVGVTDSNRALLDDGTRRHEAHIQTIDERMATFTFPDGTTERDFRDRYTYNIAAYRLDRMIGLNMVPVSIRRRVDGYNAAVTWWVDDVQMTDADRFRDNIFPPPDSDWVRQESEAVIFQELIRNTDANRGNTVITNDWRMWLIDFTRAFRAQPELFNPFQLPHQLRRSLYDGLGSLTLDGLRDALDGLMDRRRIEAILERRDAIIRHFDDLIAARGEEEVLLPD